MQANDTLTLKGRIKFERFDNKGILQETKEINNVVVNVGKNYLASWLIAATQVDYFMRYIGIGTGTAAATSSDTDLQTPLPTRVAGTLSSSTNTWQNQALFGPGINTGAWAEAGIFSATSGGTLLARQTFGVITKAAGDSIQVTWTITIS